MRLGLGLGLVRLGRAAASFVRNGLKLYYPFKDNSPDFLLDGSTSFDGTNDYIDLGASLISTNHTVSAWVYRDSSGTNDVDYLIGMRDTINDGFIIFSRSETSISSKVQTSELQYNSFTSDEWHHVASTYDGSTQRLYIDGSEVLNASISDTISVTANSLIGRDSISGGANYWNGKVANVGIWDRALSASEVESIYWRGSYSELKDTELTNLVSWYNLSSVGLLGAEVISNGTMETASSLGGYSSFPEDWTSNYGTVSIQERSSAQAFAGTHSLLFKTNASSRSGVAQTLSVTGSVSYRLEFYVYGVTGNTIQITHQTGTGTASTLDGGGTLLDYEQSVRIGEWEKITLDFTTSGSGTVTGTVLQLGSNVSGNSYYIDNVSLKRIGAGAPDSQGSNDGTIEGATTNSDSYSGESPFKPRIQDKATPKMAVQLADGSTSFDGTDDYIDTGVAFSNTVHTISGWFKLDNVSGNRTLFCGRDGNDDGIRVLLNTSQILYQVNVSDEASGTGSISANVWTHVACTYDGTTQSIYLNGSLSASQSISRTISTTETAKIGRTAYGNSDYMLGSLANIALYSSALTQTQIQELMFAEKYSGLSSDLKTNLVSWYDLGSTSLGSELVDEDARTFDGTGTHSWGIYGSNTVSNVDNNLVVTYVSDDRGAKLVLSDANDLNTDLTAGITYQVTMNVKINTGDALIRVYNGSSYETIGTVDSTSFTDVTGTFTAQVGSVTLNFDNMGSGEVITVNEFSIKEVQAPDSEGTNEGSIYGATTNTGYTSSPHGVVDPLNFGEVYSGRALSLDGTLDSVNLGVVPDYDSASGSISIWIYSHNNATPSLQGIVTNGSTGTDQHFLGIGSSKVRYSATNSSSAFTIFADSELVENQWTHVVATRSYDGANTTTKLYINGVLQADSDTFSGSQVANSNSILIGHLNVDRYFDGELNNLKIFNTALTQDQVRELYTKPETVLPTGVSASNLKLDLPMQEKAGSIVYDGSGNQNHGTISGATFVSGEEYGYQASLVRSNTPIIFDGSNDFISCGNIGIRSYPFTYSAWFRTNGTTKNTICALCDADQNVVFYQFLITDTGIARINARNTADDFCDSSGTYNDGKWHHGVAVFASATDRKIYIDGVADGSDTSSVAFGSGVDEFSIGVLNRLSKADYYDDDINEVAVWDVALDADAVSALYNSGVPLLPTSDSGNYDNSDSLMGYWRNDGKPTWTDRANTGYASFDDSDDQIALSDSSALTFGTNDFTASAWVYVNDLDNKLGVLGSETNGFGLFVETDGTISSTKTNIVGEVKSTGTLSTKNWHHIAYTRVYSTSTGTYYIDGVASGTTIDNNDYTVASKYIGRIQSTNRFDGKIAGCNYFSIPLTASEISELYAIGKRTSISGHSQFSNCVGSWLMGAGTGDTATTIQDQTSNNNDGTVSGASIIGYNDGTASGSPVEIVIPEGNTEGRDNQGYYLSDTTLISNGIRLFGSEYIDVHDSEALSFGDGISDRPFTFECWVKADDLTSKVFFSKGVYNADGEYIFSTTSADKLDLFIMDESGTNTFQRVQSPALTSYEGQWIHVVGTYDGRGGTSANDGMKLYVNGVSQTVTKSSGGTYVAMENLGSNVEIGLYHTTYSKQLIDEIRIYSKELSASEVSKNYTNGLGKHS